MTPSVSDAANALQSFNSSRTSPDAYLSQANNQYNVSGLGSQVSNLQSLVGNLQNSVAAVAPSVAGRTSGTFTTQAQRDALTNREQTPILSDLNQQNTALNTQQQQLGQAQSMAQQMAQSLMSGDQQKYQGLVDQYNAAEAADQFSKQQDLAQQQFAEQQYEFRNPQQTAGGAASSALNQELAGLFGGGSAQGQAAGGTLTGGKTSADADAAVRSLLGTNNAGTIIKTINAITDSATKHGNTYDQTKMQLLKSYAPGIFDSSGNLKVNFLNQALNQGIRLFG